MATTKAEKRNAAKKVAEARSQARKAQRASKPQVVNSGKNIKGRKSLGTGKKK